MGCITISLLSAVSCLDSSVLLDFAPVLENGAWIADVESTRRTAFEKEFGLQTRKFLVNKLY